MRGGGCVAPSVSALPSVLLCSWESPCKDVLTASAAPSSLPDCWGTVLPASVQLLLLAQMVMVRVLLLLLLLA